jgi:hypothetical protein
MGAGGWRFESEPPDGASRYTARMSSFITNDVNLQ